MSAKNPNMRYGRCNNIGNCPKANAKEVIEVPLGEDFVCPNGCGPLTEVYPSTPWKKIMIVAGVVVAVVGIMVAFLLPKEGKPVDLTQEEGAATDSCNLHVTDGVKSQEFIDVESLSFSEVEKDMTLKPGEEKQLNINCSPHNANEKIVWRSTDIGVATVSDNGQIRAIKSGISVITAVTDRSGLSASISVIVKKENEGEGMGVCKLDLGYAVYEGDIQDRQPHGNGTLYFKQKHAIPCGKDYVASPGEKVVGSFRNGKVNLATWYQKDGNEVVIK